MTERIHSLDTLKGFALMLVFFLHVRWSYVGGPALQESIGFILMTLSRLAVPLFFLTSGYLLKKKLESEEDETLYCRRYLRKIGIYYLLGSAIFFGMKLLVFALNSYLNLDVASTLELKIFSSDGLYHLLYTGKATGEHLWFLLALFYSVALIYLAYRYDVFEELLGISVILHLTAILSRTYLIQDQLPIPQDDMLFFGLALTATGFFLKKKEVVNRVNTGLMLETAVAVNILHFTERFLITAVFENYTPYFWGNYSLLTAPAAASLFIYFLARKDIGRNSRINSYGRETIWIYILHPVALGLLMGLGGIMTKNGGNFVVENIGWSMGVTLVAYFGLSEIVVRSPLEKLWKVTGRRKETS